MQEIRKLKGIDSNQKGGGGSQLFKVYPRVAPRLPRRAPRAHGRQLQGQHAGQVQGRVPGDRNVSVRQRRGGLSFSTALRVRGALGQADLNTRLSLLRCTLTGCGGGRGAYWAGMSA